MYELFLDDDFKTAWQGKDPFQEAVKLEGEIFRHVKSRQTFRFTMNGKSYFAKIHHGVGWYEILKNLTHFKKPILGAANEYHALRLLDQLGVSTMTPCAYGTSGVNPAKIESFIVTAELTDTVSLEDYCMDWPKAPPSFQQKKALTRQVARMAAAMHDGGLNHRDCYICHFLLKKDTLNELYVIDLHRAQIRSQIPWRYRVKDVAGLYFSAMDIGLNRRDLLRFIAAYGRRTPKFWNDVKTTAEKLYQRIHQQ